MKPPTTPEQLEAWRVAYMGTKGKIRSVMPMMKDVAKEEKGLVGKRLNEVKSALESGLKSQARSARRRGWEWIGYGPDDRS